MHKIFCDTAISNEIAVFFTFLLRVNEKLLISKIIINGETQKIARRIPSSSIRLCEGNSRDVSSVK